MGSVSATMGTFSVRAFIGDFKTMLSFDIAKAAAKNLAGFTGAVTPGSVPSHYVLNSLQFEDPSKHAQDAKEPPNSSINAPFQKMRWLHIPGTFHQGLTPFRGLYAYTVAPRYVNDQGSLAANLTHIEATHHGSVRSLLSPADYQRWRTNPNLQPLPQTDIPAPRAGLAADAAAAGSVIFSYGVGNKYDISPDKSFPFYAARGWTAREETPNDNRLHIDLGTVAAKV